MNQPPSPSDRKPHVLSFGGPDNEEFLLDGQPFQIRGAEMHPSRIPRPYWRHRIQMVKAMGLNTVSIYLFWNRYEVAEGAFDFETEDRAIGEFLEIAREEGVWVILRPGPYSCGEWDLGGIPWRLLRHPDIELRSLDPRYIEPAKQYLIRVAEIARPHLSANGGAILMVQIENEYGSYQRRDRAYMFWLRDFLIEQGLPGPFCTADGPTLDFLKDATLPGVATGLDPGMNAADWAIARKVNPGAPVFGAEIYPGWLCHWGEEFWKPRDLTDAIAFFMENKKSFSLYVFHGGTNFGFTAGANADPGFLPSITSYDYAAPLNEQGLPTPAYHGFRKQLAHYLPSTSFPELPAPIPAIDIPAIALERWSSVWEQLPAAIRTHQPESFEILGQDQGLMIYRTQLPAGAKGRLELAVRDYAVVYVDGKQVGVLDRRNCTLALEDRQSLELPGNDKPATLDILVDTLGHINFKLEMERDRKGLIGPVKLAGRILSEWETFPFPLKDGGAASLSKTNEGAIPGGTLFRGTFTLKTAGDTFLDLGDYQKGYVWVNGHNLGRHWTTLGPQLSLYCPAHWLKEGENTIVVLDLHASEAKPIKGTKAARS